MRRFGIHWPFIFQCEQDELRNRTIRLEYMIGELSITLSAPRCQISAHNQTHTNPVIVKEARDGMEASFMGAYDPLHNTGAVPATSATNHGTPNIHLYAQPPPNQNFGTSMASPVILPQPFFQTARHTHTQYLTMRCR